MRSQPGHDAGGALIDLARQLDLFTTLRLARLADTKSVHPENAIRVDVAKLLECSLEIIGYGRTKSIKNDFVSAAGVSCDWSRAPDAFGIAPGIR